MGKYGVAGSDVYIYIYTSCVTTPTVLFIQTIVSGKPQLNGQAMFNVSPHQRQAKVNDYNMEIFAVALHERF